MSPEQVISTARDVESLGFSYLFRSDHLLPTDNRRGLDSPECWTTLGAIAVATSRLRFGPLVSPVGFRNPALLARMASTVHALSGGRLQLALGAGWYEPEYATHGYEFPPFRVRREQFEEALSIVLPMLRDGRVDFAGRHFRANTDCFPRPAGPIRIIVGGRTRSVIRVASRVADEWNTLVSSPEVTQQNMALLRRTEGDRKVDVSEMGPFLIGRNDSELMANAKTQIVKLGQQGTPMELIKRVKSRGAFCGTPEEFSELLTTKLNSGIARFYFQALVPGNREMTGLLADILKDYS
jgi:alkanesulfonate monooxygenase SsuD/methylene tetrahydromethanopterin reductase-like flavin-dependent oxidoreductase (luciferase family)